LSIRDGIVDVVLWMSGKVGALGRSGCTDVLGACNVVLGEIRSTCLLNKK